MSIRRAQEHKVLYQLCYNVSLLMLLGGMLVARCQLMNIPKARLARPETPRRAEAVLINGFSDAAAARGAAEPRITD